MSTVLFKRLSIFLLFILISTSITYAQKPISPTLLKIALSATGWSKSPTDREINNAASAYKSKLPKHCGVSTAPYKRHGGWYPNDPLMDNKVLIHSRCNHSDGKTVNYVASLKYDYNSRSFFFENVLIRGKRDQNNPKMETSFFLQPYDLGSLKAGWTSGGGKIEPKPQPYPTPNPPQPIETGNEDDGWLTTVIGIVGAGLVAAIIARLRRKKKKAEKDKKKPGKKKKKEEEHYIIQYNKKSLNISEEDSDLLVVTVYKVTTSGGQQLANQAQITLSCEDPAIAVTKAQGKGKLSTNVFLEGLAGKKTIFLICSISAGEKNAQQSIPIHIKQENWHLDVILLPQDKTTIRPDVNDGIYIYARAAVSGQENHPQADILTQKISFQGQTNWLDIGTENFEEGWMKCYIEASNPDKARNSISMPKEGVILVSLKVGKKSFEKRIHIGLLKADLEVDRDRINFLASHKKQEVSFSAYVTGVPQSEEWQFEAKYMDPHGGDSIELSEIAMKRKAPTQVDFFLTGPLKLPAKDEKSISTTLIIYAKKEAHEKPLERHVNVSVRSEGLFLENGMDKNEQIILMADGKLDKKLEFGLYVWDEANEDMTVPQEALKKLEFSLQTENKTAQNIIEVLDPKFPFQDFIYNIPYGRYKTKSEQEIPGTGEYINCPFLVRAELRGKHFECLIPIRVRTYGIGPDFPDWQEAYDKCVLTIKHHIPFGEAYDKLTAMLERRKLTLGAEGLNALRGQIWKVAQNLILAEGASGYRSMQVWANRIVVVLEWSEWMGNIAFNVLAAHFAGPYAPVASIGKGVLVQAIIAYREHSSADDFFWKQLEQQFWGMFKAAEGRVIDVDKLERWLGVNKAYAWLIFVSYHFIVNLYKSRSVVIALQEAAREARDEFLVSWLLGKVRAEASSRGYKIPPKETMETINKVKNNIKTDHAGRQYVDKKLVVEIMQDPQKVRTLKNHAPVEVQKAFENTRSSMQKAHDADLVDWISKEYGIPPQNIKVDDFRTPGAEGFSLNTDRDYRVVVRSGRKGANGKDMWLELSTKKWANKSHEFFGKHTEKPANISAEEWSQKCQQMPTDKHHIEASADYSDQAINPKTGELIKVKPNILKVKAGKGTLIDPEGLGNMYHEKVDAAIRDNNIPEAYAQSKKGVDSLKKVRKGYKKQGYKTKELPKNMEKAMEIVMKAPVDDTATPARIKNVEKQLKSLGFQNLKDFSNKVAGQFKSLGNVKKAPGYLKKWLG